MLLVFYVENGEIIMMKEIVNYVVDLFVEYGLNIWFEREVKDLLLEGFIYLGSFNGIFIKEIDIMDVWFDFGLLYCGVLEIRLELSFLVDMYLEGSD